MKVYKIDRFLLGLIILAFLLRLPAILNGLPATYNSTEYYLSKIALEMGANRSLDPGTYIYPTFYSYVLLCLYSGFFLVGNILGIFTDVFAFAVQFLIDPSGFYIVSRISNVLLFLFLLSIVYVFLHRYTGREVARLASLMMFFSSYLYQYSCYGTADMLLIFFSTLTIIYFYVVSEQPTNKNILLAGIFSGLAIAAKYNAGFLAFGLIFLVIQLKRSRHIKIAEGLAYSTGGMFVGFIITNPYWVIAPQKFWDGFRLISAQMYSAVSVQSGEPFLWEIITIIKDEYIVGALFIVATIYYFFSGERKHLPGVTVILLTYLFVGSWTKKGVDYLFSAYPAWIFLASFFIVHCFEYYKIKKNYRILILIIFFLPSSIGVFHQFITYLNQDTREKATDWIIKNVQKNESICYDNSHIDLGVYDINRYISYGVTSEKLPKPVKEKLKDYKNAPRQINFTPILIPNPSSTLKTDNPYETEAVKFRRRHISELIQLGTDYLITNNHYYETFLITNLRSYPLGVQIGIQEVRQFYDQLFHYYDPIISFLPTFWNAGPEIRIYDLHKIRREKK